MKTIVVFLADGFEECEGLAVVDLLRRAGDRVIMASIMDRLTVTAAHNVVVTADVEASEVDYSDVDMIVLPGGGVGTQNLAKSELVCQQCRAFAEEKQLAAICAAPTVLAGLGLLEGRRATCYPGMEGQMQGAVMTGEKAVVDGNIITGRGPGAAFDFALELIRQLHGAEAAESIRTQIVYE